MKTHKQVTIRISAAVLAPVRQAARQNKRSIRAEMEYQLEHYAAQMREGSAK